MSSTPSPDFLDSLRDTEGLPTGSSWCLIAAATALTLSQFEWIPLIYRAAVSPYPPVDNAALPSPPFLKDGLPRRRIVRQLKEACLKASALIGVPKVIEGLLKLDDALDLGDRDDSCLRKDYLSAPDSGEVIAARGRRAVEAIYKEQLAPIESRFKPYLEDLQWSLLYITDGLLMSPVNPDDPNAPLTFLETEVVAVTCLVAQRLYREVLWHVRGLVRVGATTEQAEAVQAMVERVAQAMGVDVKTGIPRVHDIKLVDDLSS